MIVRTPIPVYATWIVIFGISFSPFLLGAGIINFFDLSKNKVATLAIGLPTLALSYFIYSFLYLSIFRNYRRRILQSQFRRKALRSNKPFVLISRSYDQSKEFRTYVPSVTPYNDGGELALLEALIFDLSHRYAVVVLGDKDLDPDDPAGRALFMSPTPTPPRNQLLTPNCEVEDNGSSLHETWEEIFLSAARAAQFVFLIPADSEGVRTEIRLLRMHNLGAKTIIFMWPEIGVHPYSAICASGESWEALRVSLDSEGLKLPSHIPSGALLQFDSDLTKLENHEQIPRKNLLSAISDSPDFVPLCVFANIVRDYEITINAARFGPMWGVFENSPDTLSHGSN